MITVTLQQIRDAHPCTDGWTKALKAHGPDLNREFPLVDILDSNGLFDTLWCMDRLNLPLRREFACYAALINIELIKPFCSDGDYEKIVSYLNNPTDAAAAAAAGRAADAAGRAADAADAAAYAAGRAAAGRAAYAAGRAADAAAYAAATAAGRAAYAAATAAGRAAAAAAAADVAYAATYAAYAATYAADAAADAAAAAAEKQLTDKLRELLNVGTR